MFSPFKNPTLEPPRDALDTAVRDAIAEIEAIYTLRASVPLAQEINSLPLPTVLRDRAAATIAEWTAAFRRARYAETFEESARGFRTLRDQMVESAKRLAN